MDIVLIITLLLFLSSISAYAESDWRDIFPYLYIYDKLTYVEPRNYYIHDVPSFADYNLTTSNVGIAFAEWEELNKNNLRFVKVHDVKDADISINWVKEIEYEYTVRGLTNSTIQEIDGIQTILFSEIQIDVGDYDCNNNWVHWNSDVIKYILKHEIGHTLGLRHSSDKNNLMYSYFDGEDVYDSLGYVLPNSTLGGGYVGEGPLISEYEMLSLEIGSLKNKINLLNEKYDKKMEKWEKRFEPGMYGKAKQIEKDMNYIRKDIDSLIDKEAELIEKINPILDSLRCFPYDDQQQQ